MGSYSSLIIVAYLKDPNTHEGDNFYWVLIGLLIFVGSISMACIFCLNDALASNYARKHNVTYGSIRFWSSIGWFTGALTCLLLGFANITFLRFRVASLLVMFIAISLDIALIVLWPYAEDFEMFHDGTTIQDRKMSIVGPNTLMYIASKQPRLSISKDILDNIKAGRSKSMGAISKYKAPLDDTFKAIDTIEKKPCKEYSNIQCQKMLLKAIAKTHPNLVKYICLFMIYGCLQTAIWTFSFKFLKNVITSKAKDLESAENQFDLISPLCLMAQSVGEVPTYMISGFLLRNFGVNALVSLSFVSLGLRAFFYSNILPYCNPYFVLMAEVLSGPSVGIYFVSSVEIASHYALMVTEFIPKLKSKGIVRDRVHERELEGCLRATMIGLVSGSMEGLGAALGGYLAGEVLQIYDYNYLWFMCAITAWIIGFGNISWDLIQKLVRKPKSKSIIEDNNRDIALR